MEKPEREVTDMIGRPIFIVPFPAEMEAFNMRRIADRTLPESVDLLILGVGEIVSWSM